MMDYMDFLKSKIDIAPSTGFHVELSEINPKLKPHQQIATQWALEGGCRALFESFGLGKTAQELEYSRLASEHTGGQSLITLPLGVKQEFYRDAVELLHIEPPEYVRTMEEVQRSKSPLLMTNYERIRDGDIRPSYFKATCLDEASVLRSFGSKTYQTFLKLFKNVPFKLVATATPSPNKYKELIHYAGFLGIMDTGQALTRWFQRDSTKANNLTIYPHKEQEFWFWVSTWALFITNPTDLGFSDEGYDLPPLIVRYHEIPVDHNTAGYDRDGQFKIFRDAAMGLQDAAREKRESIVARVAKMKEIIEESSDDHFILWHDLEAERHAIEETLPSKEYHHWQEYKDGNPKGLELYERHYSAYQYADGRERKLFCGPGEKIVLMTRRQDALFVWRKFIDASGEKGINCAIFRNESNILSSELIKEAMFIAQLRWPGERLYTYVNSNKIKSVNPGCCFKKAGWKRCGATQGGLIILEAYQLDNPKIKPMRALESIYGSQDLDIREQRVIDFSNGKIKYFATKKELSGSGCNFQRHCHRSIFVGINYEFNDFLQAIHRIYRFLQTEQVTIDIIYTESERQILQALLKKWKQHDYLVQKMIEIIKKYGLSSTSITEKLARTIGVERVEVKGKHFTAINNDCILEAENMEENSIDLIVTSIPFGNHYEYTASYNDFGHNEDTERFFEQMDYLSPNLLRVLKPGRVFACHTKDRVLFGNATGTGMPTIEPFHALCISHYMKHGFQYFGMITIVTDVVRENNQTYRLGWTMNCRDGTKMGVGCPEYILLFRKLPTDTSTAFADVPVVKTKEEYTRAQWQIDAHAYWRSSGDRLLTKEELQKMPINKLQAAYRKYSRESVYSYEEHVALAKSLDKDGRRLPASFMVVAPGSWTDEVWDDINRMRTLNTQQSQKRLQMHVCLAKGSLVLTRSGYKPIEDILVGDMLLTHKGNWKSVITKKCTGENPVIQTKAQGVANLITTPEHKLWVRKTDKVRAKDYMLITPPEWIEAQNTKGAWLNLKLPDVEPSGLTKKEWWIVGRYLADGHMGTRGDFHISVGKHKKEEFEIAAAPYIGSFAEHDALQYRLKGLPEGLKNMLRKCGKGAENKQVPIEGICLNKEKASCLLNGYLSGDGNKTGNATSASSVSRALLLGIAMVAQRARGVIPSIYAGKPEGKYTIQGREVNQRQLWVMSWRESEHHRSGAILEDGAWKKVAAIKDKGAVETWSIQVADDESYTAEGCIVKNCPLQFDIVERIINRYSNPGELVLDPFAGLMTVPERAVMLDRKGIGIELNSDYFRDGVGYLKAREALVDMPSLFDLELEEL